MLKVKDAKELGVGLADKAVGLAFEVAGTITGNERLKESGRDRQDAGTEKLRAVEEEVKATRRRAGAEIAQTRQKAHQPVNKRSAGPPISDQDNALEATAEKVKGAAKKGFATVTGNEQMKEEAEAQQDKASEQLQAAKHEARSELHERRAEQARQSSERERRSS
ncbi:MAG TPA: hypothetical protein VKV69_08080 [Actinomycetota bacterium]|nr:hypothetical protein [Actinomycetota bacterium]